MDFMRLRIKNRDKKTFFKDIQHTNFKNIEQTRLTADSVIQSIGYSSKSLVDKSMYCLLKCEKYVLIGNCMKGIASSLRIILIYKGRVWCSGLSPPK